MGCHRLPPSLKQWFSIKGDFPTPSGHSGSSGMFLAVPPGGMGGGVHATAIQWVDPRDVAEHLQSTGQSLTRIIWPEMS